jgi:hypothetical protein
MVGFELLFFRDDKTIVTPAHLPKDESASG